ncbi:uncharacterized protein LOC121052597 [Rosa chinensis]|uniref:uncharacterized protein LOC121052597 n=1 Tax=Rosa chinensis TaxID=74649 RepID=UPI001AD8D0EE|nr:uncharacterized protein LOC121052597 [Rosa chinensis]
MRMPGESQDTNVTREKCKGEDDKENLIIVEEAMTDEEKQTRNWILQNNVAETDYELYEDFDCPQQNPSSGDCRPFMLHYMESIVNGVEPTKEGGDNMRKRLLERFMHLVLGRK